MSAREPSAVGPGDIFDQGVQINGGPRALAPQLARLYWSGTTGPLWQYQRCAVPLNGTSLHPLATGRLSRQGALQIPIQPACRSAPDRHLRVEVVDRTPVEGYSATAQWVG